MNKHNGADEFICVKKYDGIKYFENLICFHNFNNKNNISKILQLLCFSVNLENMRLQKPIGSTCLAWSKHSAQLQSKGDKRTEKAEQNRENSKVNLKNFKNDNFLYCDHHQK